MYEEEFMSSVSCALYFTFCYGKEPTTYLQNMSHDALWGDRPAM